MAQQIVVIGAGIGGLCAAVLLAAQGHEVTLLERAATLGGKARQVLVDGAAIDAGPTVFTLPDVFEAIFAQAGRSLGDYITATPARILARHAWGEGAQLDLFADPAASEAAIGAFAGAREAAGFRAFCAEAQRIHAILDASFIRAGKVSWPGPLMWRIGLWRLGALHAIRPYESMWSALGAHFRDPRLRQLFARYATYCGSSPFRAPATLMLIAHVEQQGVWLIEGGMSALAEALARLATELGVRLRPASEVAKIEVTGARASGVVLADGGRLKADAIIANADPAALAAGLFGPAASRATRAMPAKHRSLSAITWLAHARTSGFALSRHNVFFSGDYPREFAELAQGRVPGEPTIYVCAQDRPAEPCASPPAGRERLQILINAPANGDTQAYGPTEIEPCTHRMRRLLARSGLELEEAMPHQVASPATFARMFPSTGGALYGRASHGWAASFLRQGARTRIPGLYCAGGATHPGAGVPMAALSGMLAASTLMRDLASTRRFHPAAMAGGISMRSATTGSTA